MKNKSIVQGGIRPDIYVKIDTSGYNRFYNKLITKKVLFDFVYDFLGRRYDAEELDQNVATFMISDNDYRDLLRYIQNKNIVIDQRQLLASKSLIYNDVKLLLYKYHLGDAGYYKALNLSDTMVKQALASLQ
ncbi:hypothetical protein D3C78_1362630 [compost metagenome]